VSQEFDAILQERTEGAIKNNFVIGTHVRKCKIAALGRHLKSGITGEDKITFDNANRIVAGQ
jgi:hypothetical protein